MQDLISRQAAIDALESIGSLDTNADREYARSVFETLPSAQPEIEPKTGRWKHVEIESNYCPNCGADMRSKAREYLEYGELITKGIAEGLRGDSDE